MIQFFISLIAFIVALGILVSVHEFGHFWVARRLGVKVLRFSLGFGKPLWRFYRKNDETEYVISALPLGGYVKMLDEREGEVHPDERHLAFNNKSVWKRIAIVAAGPLFNFILAIFLYFLAFSIGIPGVKPVIGNVVAESPAAVAGFRSGDRVIAVEGQPTRTWQEVRLGLLNGLLESEQVEIDVRVLTAELNEVERTVVLGQQKILKEDGDVLENLGLGAWQPIVEPIVGEVVAGGAAEKTGLQAGDKIQTVDKQKVSSWMDLVENIRTHPGQRIELEVLRNNQTIHMEIVPDRKEENGQAIGFIGVQVRVPDVDWEAMRVTVRYPLIESVYKSLEKTWDMTYLSFRMIGKLIMGDASPRNISGPITIAEYAGKTVQIDFSFFLDFLAIISIGLGVLNILPIPLLDGGHLLYYFIEIVIRRPLSEKAQLVGQNIGIVLLACLMTLAFYNDITRLMR